MPHSAASRMDPSQDTAEPISQTNGVTESIVRKGQKNAKKRRRRGKGQHSRGNINVRGGGSAPWQNRYPLQTVENPIPEQMDIPKGSSLSRACTGAQEKKKEQQRETAVH